MISMFQDLFNGVRNRIPHWEEMQRPHCCRLPDMGITSMVPRMGDFLPTGFADKTSGAASKGCRVPQSIEGGLPLQILDPTSSAVFQTSIDQVQFFSYMSALS